MSLGLVCRWDGFVVGLGCRRNGFVIGLGLYWGGFVVGCYGVGLSVYLSVFSRLYIAVLWKVCPCFSTAKQVTRYVFTHSSSIF